MTTIPGASGFLNAATLANRQGLGAQQATVLGDGGLGGVDILDVARGNRPKNGVGLSSRARLLNKQLIDSNSTTFNAIFSLGLGGSATIEGLQQQILALRAATPSSKLARNLVGNTETTGSETVDKAVAEAIAEAEAVKKKLADAANVTLLTQQGKTGVDAEA